MKFLVDQNLSRGFADALRAAGHDVVHTSEVGLATAPDGAVMQRAVEDGRVLISADTDFGTLLAASSAALPSVVLVRLRTPRDGDALAAVVLANLDAVALDLHEGAIVVLEDERVRVRRLPVR